MQIPSVADFDPDVRASDSPSRHTFLNLDPAVLDPVVVEKHVGIFS